MNNEIVKENLIKMVKREKNITFIEIERYFDCIGYCYEGDKELRSGTDKNTIFWSGWNNQAIQLLQELVQDNLINMKCTQYIAYYLNGVIIEYPVYKGDRPFKQWLPVEFN
jgi:similarity